MLARIKRIGNYWSGASSARDAAVMRLPRALPTGRKISFDCGSSTSAMIIDGSAIYRQPTMILIEKATRKVVGYGDVAREAWDREADGFEAVMPMKDGEVRDPKLAVAFMQMFYADAMKELSVTARATWLGTVNRPIYVLLPVPTDGSFTSNEALVKCVRTAFVTNDVGLIDESLSSGLGAGAPVHSPAGCIVVNVGGGTTDLAIFSSLRHVTKGRMSIKVAGREFDRAIRAKVRTGLGLEIGEPTAERIKIRVGSAMQLNGNSPPEMEVYGRRISGKGDNRAMVTSDFAAEALDDSLTVITGAISEKLRVEPELMAMVFENGAWLTGGGAQLRQFGPRISNDIPGVPHKIPDNPADCSVLGASKTLEESDLFTRVVNDWSPQ